MKNYSYKQIKEIVIASTNRNKLKEFSELFKELNIVLYLQSEFGINYNEENNNTFFENALNKARHVSRLTGLPALAEDSGLCVESLQNKPGIFSARYASNNRSSNDIDNNKLLIKNLEGIKNRNAYYISNIVLIRNPNDYVPIMTYGICKGTIVDEPFGTNGFGYDPHFFLPSIGKTMASISINEKNNISHRSIASKKLIQELNLINN
ncbi:nucleoside-triphosphatase [Candidatus Kinetoplastibacterium desouzaii TCC079E]|uniref:dITP/XTP pyrophosphatase n=1 Tax=Candidatus Kinetoplastidibacterium desouzai TCC079E TaxID=1208919 RepID=M1LUD0_9PROT|nr:RdgB/HAM1 family non-canonical purine NTP pyrophosphatase [Candidatus Kinetoplastibacterium desouzaii]AGF46909.1 nucleoside-triphosphatase [Candidatus Kinetoplastibacterium desouzaii TCC079E]